MIAPPCIAPNLLLSSSRTKISASTLSLETCVTFIPIKLANGGCNSASRFMSWLIVRQRLRGSPRNCRAAAHRSQYASAGAGRAKSAATAALSFSGRTFAALLRRRHDADVRFWRLPALRIELLGLVVGDGAGEDDVFALLPVRGRRDAVLGGELQRVDHAQHLVEIAARGHRINQHELDLLVRPDDENIAHGHVIGRCAAFRRAASRCR